MKKNSCAIYDDKLKIASNLNRITKSNKIKKLTIGSSASSFVILNHQFLKDEQKVIFKFNNKKYSFSTKLIGRVQIKNLLTLAFIISQIYQKNIIMLKFNLII